MSENTKNTKELAYTRDEVFIIAVNDSSNRIELLESKIYVEPMLIYAYFGCVSALYSKTHKYVMPSRKIGKKLETIRSALYNTRFVEHLKHEPDQPKTKVQFLKLLDSLVSIYRSMTDDFTLGIFPKVKDIDTNPGVTKY